MTTSITNKYIDKRIVATLIDYVIIFGMTIFYIFQVGTPNSEGDYAVSGLPALIPGIFWFIYIVLAEQYLGGTFGHLLLKLKGVSINGRKITLTQTLKRRTSDILEISWCFGFVAYLLAKNTQSNQRLGDILAKTVVIGSDAFYPEVAGEFEI